MGEYIDIEDIRNEGVSEDEADDTRLTDLIEMAEQYIEDMTGQHFYEKETTMTLYGRDTKTIFLPVHIISCEEIRVDGEQVETENYTVFNRYMPDDRGNPKIVFESNINEGEEVEVEGSFGYVEEDGSTPAKIKFAVKKLVIHQVPELTDIDGQDEKKRGRIVRERTDKYEYELAEMAGRKDLTGDPEIDNVIIRYQAPIGGGVV